jgi:gluconolactonase
MRVDRFPSAFGLALALLATVSAADGQLPVEAEPKLEGRIGAGEGPAWREGWLYFTGGDRITRRTPEGKVEVFREPSGRANGLLVDPQNRLVICESGNRRITRLEPDGSVTVLADSFEGKRFNSPNDLTIDSKGRIYFTDPRYGKRDGMEILDAEGRAVEGVYRIDAPGKVARVIAHEVDRPNGVLVSPRDEFLYVADNNNNTQGGARKLWRFSFKSDGGIDLASRKEIYDWQDGRGPDGLKMDTAGRLYVAGGLNKPNPPYEPSEKFKGGIYILSPDGKLIQFVHIPVDEVTNCAFGGADRKTLYITAGGTLWSVPVSTPGWSPKPH